MKSEPRIRGENRIYSDNTQLVGLKKTKLILKTIIDFDITQEDS